MKILKYTVLAVASLSLAALTYGQGVTGYANNPTQPIIDGATGAPAGNNYTTGLYYGLPGTDPGAFELVGTAPVISLGVFNNGGLPIEVPEPGGTSIQVVIKAWTGAFASYEEALANGGANDWVGVSNPTVPYNLASAGSPPPSLLIQGQWTGFETVPVPEPSTVVLGLLGGLGALVLLRRRV